jgi:DNA-binding CsgD family transcriptional regulator
MEFDRRETSYYRLTLAEKAQRQMKHAGTGGDSGIGRSAFLIDAADALSGAPDGDARWEAANSLASALGASAIVVTGYAEGSYLPDWARSSMSSDWRRDYWNEGLFRTDPLLQGRMLGAVPEVVRAEVVADSREVPPGVAAWGRLLFDAGYATLMPRVFPDATGPCQTAVTILSQADAADLPDRTTLSALLALIAAHIGPPEPGDTAGAVSAECQVLTDRERDVLCLLAQGLTTGRIAERLGLAEVTVHKHFRTAREKMGAATREQTLALAMVRGQLAL